MYCVLGGQLDANCGLAVRFEFVARIACQNGRFADARVANYDHFDVGCLECFCCCCCCCCQSVRFLLFRLCATFFACVSKVYDGRVDQVSAYNIQVVKHTFEQIVIKIVGV